TSLSGNYTRITNNFGNYGVIYKITVTSKKRVGVIFSPRGGVFAGAGKWDSQAFYLPNQGILKPQTEFALIGILEPNKQKTLEFIPPAGSYLPINIIFYPF
ncbi:MAG: copper amine oxidase, partial [Firmicutes bacterium]|nr:copper amine oxidase [Bacillota bacterium]